MKSIVWALRRAGYNPTEQQMMDVINKMDDGSGNVSFDSFTTIIRELASETDPEAVFKNAFRAFFKDEEGWFALNVYLIFVLCK